MKFLVAGGYDTQNLGDYASLLGLKNLFSAEGLEPEFVVLSRHPDDGFSKQVGVKTILNFDYPSKELSMGNIFRGFNENDSVDHLQDIYTHLCNSDALLIGNGRLFIDITLDFMRGPLSYFVLLVTLAKMIGKPVIVFSMTLVEPETKEGREHLAFILQNASLVLIREVSSKNVADKYVENSEKIYVLPDVAFALTRDDAGGDDIEYADNNSIAINIRGINYDNQVNREKVLVYAKSLESILDRNDVSLLFCSQMTYDVDSKWTDDRHANRVVLGHMSDRHQGRCHLIDRRLTLQETLRLYQSISGVVTSRRHGFIMGLTQACRCMLVCEEKNTKVLNETIPIPELYFNDFSEFNSEKLQNYPDVGAVTDKLKAVLQKYPQLITQTISKKCKERFCYVT